MSNEETDIGRFIRHAGEGEGAQRAALMAGLGGTFAGPVGGALGGAVGAGDGARLRSAAGGFLGGFAGPVAGAGAYMAHPNAHEKEASLFSVAQVSAIADLIEEGHFGKEAQYAFDGITSSVDRYVEEELIEKTASHVQTDYTIYDENAARLARLDNLLRKP